MAQAQELPQLVSEFVEMAGDYVRQETIEPAKSLGRYFGFSFGAGLLAAIGAVPLVVGGTRWLVYAMPDDRTNAIWTGTGYVLMSLVVFAVAGLVGWAVSR